MAHLSEAEENEEEVGFTIKPFSILIKRLLFTTLWGGFTFPISPLLPQFKKSEEFPYLLKLRF